MRLERTCPAPTVRRGLLRATIMPVNSNDAVVMLVYAAMFKESRDASVKRLGQVQTLGGQMPLPVAEHHQTAALEPVRDLAGLGRNTRNRPQREQR
jgi:hypothetical protein